MAVTEEAAIAEAELEVFDDNQEKNLVRSPR
jgi:hypothetical protein